MEATSLKSIVRAISFSLFIIYFWFGIQKFFPHVSPAEEIAGNTIQVLTFGFLSFKTGLMILAVWEVGIAFFILCCPTNRIVMGLTILHLIFTFTPFLFFPSLTLGDATGSLTLLGQYIVKNLLLICCVYFLYKVGPNLKGSLYKRTT
ncbi:MAG: hypothetical protein KDC49_09605 [Saprospiraceae bacterium]|nr:hypothetical protein [Saprospiraceae bacterium]